MSDRPPSNRNDIQLELDRLKLDWASSPYSGYATSGSTADLVEQLRKLQPGATWADVIPILGAPPPSIGPYKPQGPWDYQQPPAGPALFALLHRSDPDTHVHELLERAAAAGFSIYGAGVHQSAAQDRHYVSVVLPLNTSEDLLWAVGAWIEEQPGWELGGCNRSGDESYVA